MIPEALVQLQIEGLGTKHVVQFPVVVLLITCFPEPPSSVL